MQQLVIKKLKNPLLVKLKFPEAEKMAYFAQLIQVGEPAVDDVIGFIDGLLDLTCECTSELIEHNAMFKAKTKYYFKCVERRKGTHQV